MVVNEPNTGRRSQVLLLCVAVLTVLSSSGHGLSIGSASRIVPGYEKRAYKSSQSILKTTPAFGQTLPKLPGIDNSKKAKALEPVKDETDSKIENKGDQASTSPTVFRVSVGGNTSGQGKSMTKSKRFGRHGRGYSTNKTKRFRRRERGNSRTRSRKFERLSRKKRLQILRRVKAKYFRIRKLRTLLVKIRKAKAAKRAAKKAAKKANSERKSADEAKKVVNAAETEAQKEEAAEKAVVEEEKAETAEKTAQTKEIAATEALKEEKAAKMDAEKAKAREASANEAARKPAEMATNEAARKAKEANLAALYATAAAEKAKKARKKAGSAYLAAKKARGAFMSARSRRKKARAARIVAKKVHAAKRAYRVAKELRRAAKLALRKAKDAVKEANKAAVRARELSQVPTNQDNKPEEVIPEATDGGAQPEVDNVSGEPETKEKRPATLQELLDAKKHSSRIERRATE